MKKIYALLGALVVIASCNNDIVGLGPPSDPTTETFAPSLGVNVAQMSPLNGIYYKDVQVGAGKTVTDSASLVNVTYAGYLKDGTLFDSGINVAFNPGALIAGMRIGLMGMKEGGKRKLVIPSALGYGGSSVKTPDGTIKIPRQSTLVFDAEVIKVTNVSTTATP